MASNPEVRVNEQVAAKLPLGLLDVRVLAGDVRLIVLGFLATLVVALPIGYGTGFLVPPTVPDTTILDAFVNISKIVLFEEFLFRTLIFGALYNRLGLGRAVAINAVLFGAIHLIKFTWPMMVMAGWRAPFLRCSTPRPAAYRRPSSPTARHRRPVLYLADLIKGLANRPPRRSKHWTRWYRPYRRFPLDSV